VLGDVKGGVGEGGVVRRRHVPRGERSGPDGEGHGGAEEQLDQPAHRRGVRERTEQRARQQEQGDRSADAQHEQERARVADQQVLEHVRRDQRLLGDLVERRHGRERPGGDAGREEERLHDACSLPSATP
jgi:hypothetical protein